ncbi:MAG TPA: Hsp20/alpha crystallin family protein [Acidimicrobiia bacterium]|nr:Hsp20/alpha crystallin family protein [Acidimicrobiia bacterium]
MTTRFVPLSSIDRFTSDFFDRAWREVAPRMDRQIPVDAYQRDEDLFVHFDLPGVREDDIELSLERRVLSVRAERRYSMHDGDQVLMAERPWGTLSRQIVLGDTLDANRVSASFDNGVLTVRVPLAQNAKSRRIEITHAPVQTDSKEIATDDARDEVTAG